MFAFGQPVVDPVCQFDAEIVCGALLVEYQMFPTAWASEIATVVYRQPQMLYAIWLAMQHSTRLQV
tara:strand:- start:944 stop:1141 length:198 start_codon:yes stop_codon:yes gene_type:complete